MLISTIGSSMIWPFLMIYVSKKLDLPLTTIASLFTINAAMSLIFSFIAGPITDRIGRKWVMFVSLLGTGLMYLFLSGATTFLHFAIIQCLMGALGPLYRVGVDAMLADLVPTEKRPDAYALMRMSNNAGVSIGPAIGGIIATQSYNLAFYIAAAGLTFYALLIGFKARETLPAAKTITLKKESIFSGYGRIFKDREFMGFVSAFTLTTMLASLVWILLPVYANTDYQISESRYGFIPTTNAIMVVAFQVLVTNITKRFKPIGVMMIGTVFYAIATGAIVFFTGFWGFWLCMVVLTIGELIISPTSTTFTADLAPADMRGRYMSIYGLTWSIAFGIAPVFGGFLNDNFGPKAIWIGGAAIGVLSILAFAMLRAKYEVKNDRLPSLKTP
jgi:MFS family permease